MKKSLVALAVLGTLAGTASAQSSVTLFGILDAGVFYGKGGGKEINTVSSGGMQTSRFGLRGTEDLGGGLKANFWLESQVNGDTGTSDTTAASTTAVGSKFWGRRATVGLSGDFGEFRVGRDKTSVRNIIDDFDAFGAVGIGDITANQTFASNNLGANALGTATAPVVLGNNRNDNEVRYFLPSNLGGIYGSVEMGYGEGVYGQKMYGGKLGYKEGPLNIAVGMQISTVNTMSKWGHGAVAASYDFGVVKIGVIGVEAKYVGRKQDMYGVNAQIPLGQGLIKVQYAQSNANTAAETAKVAYDGRLMSAAYVYSLSKRTSLYGVVSELKNKGAGTMSLAISQASAIPASTPGGTSSAFGVGLTHLF